MDTALAVALTALGLVTLASGLALLLAGRARASGGLLLASGLALVVATLLESADRTTLGEPLFVGYVLGLSVAVAWHPVPRWRHPVDFVALVVIVGAGVLTAAQPRDADVRGSLGLVVAFAVGLHLWWRLERADERERLPLTWLALTLAAVGTLSGLVVLGLENRDGIAAAAFIWCVVPPTMYLSTVRPGLLDVRSLVVRAVVVLVAAIGYMSLFVALESLLEVLGSGSPSVGILAALGAISALTFHPLEIALHGVVDALLFGVRPDPLGAAAQMADQIGEDPEQALRAIRAALVLPYAAIELDGRVVAASGDRVTATREVALTVGTDDAGRPVGGTLVVGLRPGDLSLGDDETVLRLVGQILAQTLRARALAADLRESRGQVVDALEEERRRLRRDLHDGLGPRLSGIAFTADAARNSLRADPALAEQLLADLRAETATAIADIRALVYGMCPPALDELGLVGALRQQARALRAVDGAPVTVEFRAAELPELGAAVEVAAYRIVVEALTNVARHSAARTASVTLEPSDGALRVEVRDDGGPARVTGRSAWTAGVGISAMRERAAEVGGDLVAAPGDAGGRVLATLPIRSAAR